MKIHPFSNQLVSVKLETDANRHNFVEIHGFLLGYFNTIYGCSWKDSGALDSIMYSIRQKNSTIPEDDNVSIILSVKGFNRFLAHDSEIIHTSNQPLEPITVTSILTNIIAGLKTCARCGKIANLQLSSNKWRVTCIGSCHTVTAFHNYPEKAVEEWNKLQTK